MENVREKKGIAGKVILTVAAVLGGICMIVYLGLSIYFMNHFFFRTTLNGRDVSCYTIEQVKEIMEEGIQDYQLNIVERNDVVESILGADVDLNINWDQSIPMLLYEQNGFTWIGKLIHPEDLVCDTVIDYDENKVETQIMALSCMDKSKQVEPIDAKISEFDKENGFTIIAPVDGTVIDDEVFATQVKQALLEMRESCSIEEMGAYVEAQIKEDDEQLVSMADKLNKYAGSEINFEVGEDKWTLDASTFKDWLTLDKDGNLVVDKDKVADYVKELSNKYTTCYSAKKFKTSYGKTVTIKNSRYGWKVDEEEEQKAILKEIKAGKKVDRDLHYSMTANSHGKNEFGDSYVEINLSTQHLFLYKEGKLVLETDFVSGNLAQGNATPTGIFGITYTERNAVLNGANYSTPVSFWMPFNGNVGMHDATWRASFGGSIYKTHGSHGCVNLPYDAAEKIFSVVSKNYPVIVYATSEADMPAVTAATPKPQETVSSSSDTEEEKNKTDKNKTDKNKTTDKNKSDKNKSDKNKTNKNKTNKNKTEKNKTDKNKTDKDKTDKETSEEPANPEPSEQITPTDPEPVEPVEPESTPVEVAQPMEVNKEYEE